MKKLLKILRWAAGAAVLLLLLAVVGLKLFFPLEKAKALAIAKAQEKLDRPVAVADVALSLRGGVGVKLMDVSIGNPPHVTGEPLLTAAAVDLKLAFWPLLKGDIRAHRLVIDAPHLELVRLPDGRDNFTFPAREAPVPATGGPDGAGQEAMAASIERISVRDGRVGFQDLAKEQVLRLYGLELGAGLANPAPNRFQFAGQARLDSLQVQGPAAVPPLPLALDFRVDYDLGLKRLVLEPSAFTLQDLRLSLGGELAHGDGRMQAQGRLKAADLALTDLLALLPAEQNARLAEVDVSGRLGCDLALDFDQARAEPFSYEGTVTVADLTARHRSAPGELTIALATAGLRPDLLELTTDRCAWDGQPLQVRLLVENFTEPRLTADLTAQLDLAKLQPYLPETGKPRLSGRLQGSVHLQGAPDAGIDLLRQGRADIQGLAYADERLNQPVERCDLSVRLSPGLITLDRCDVRFPASNVALTGSIKDPFPYFLPDRGGAEAAVPQPTVQFALHAGKLDLDGLMPPARAKSGGGPSTGAAPPSAAAAGMPDVIGQGTVQVDSLIFNRVEFTAITCQARLHDRSVTCSDIKGRMYQGQAAGEATFGLADLARPTYSCSFQATQIEADDFLSRFTPFGGLFYGKFDLQGEFAAAGREAATVRNTLTLDGLAKMYNGKVVTSGFAYTALSNLAGKLGQNLDREQGLRELATLIKVQDGKVTCDQLTTRLGQLGDLSLGGHYSFAGDLKYQGTLLLSAAQTEKLLKGGGVLGGLTELLGGTQGDRLALPLTVDGTLAKPQLKIDYAALTQRAGQNLQDEAKDRLKNLFK